MLSNAYAKRKTKILFSKGMENSFYCKKPIKIPIDKNDRKLAEEGLKSTWISPLYRFPP